MEYHLFAIYVERVPCVGTTLETGYNIVVGSKKVYDLTLSFVAPLKAYQYINHPEFVFIKRRQI
jgi:hypothetical protein